MSLISAKKLKRISEMNFISNNYINVVLRNKIADNLKLVISYYSKMLRNNVFTGL